MVSDGGGDDRTVAVGAFGRVGRREASLVRRGDGVHPGAIPDGARDPWAVPPPFWLSVQDMPLDLAFWRMGEVFLKRWPLCVSLMESVFITLLCYHDTGLSSPFRWYYLLSLICCSIRYSSAVAWWTVAFHSVSLVVLYRILGVAPFWESTVPLTLTIMAWVTWACSSLAGSLHAAGQQLEHLNGELAVAREDLEHRVEERTEALRASQRG